MKQRLRRQAGDTIVEVMICIGVISLVLTGAFVVANRSTNTVQDSNEHSQAALYLQTQVELVRNYLSNHSTAPFTAPSCMDPASGNPVAAASPACSIPNGGATYKISGTQSSDLYTFTVTWDSVTGGTAQESYVYRAYPQS